MIIAKYDLKTSASFEILSLFELAVTYPEVFGQTGTHIEEIFIMSASRYSKNALLALSVLRFFCKIFSKLLKLTLRKTLFRGLFLKIYI